MTRDNDSRVVVLSRYLAVLAAATIVLSMQAPHSDSVALSFISATRFVVAVAAVIFGFIGWFERRFPLEDDAIDLRSESARVPSHH